ncbi:protein of unknown function [Bradyrhizobium vignae]|uniref:Uncharacterized protein n=1 Tax=Bradyrhizobium vignae TaxID=1549949 RepID=A0A2U3PVT0_9BRAD|nr:protein of unknown function [Bradyrhizobium vignae]
MDLSVPLRAICNGMRQAALMVQDGGKIAQIDTRRSGIS